MDGWIDIGDIHRWQENEEKERAWLKIKTRKDAIKCHRSILWRGGRKQQQRMRDCRLYGQGAVEEGRSEPVTLSVSLSGTELFMTRTATAMMMERLYESIKVNSTPWPTHPPHPNQLNAHSGWWWSNNCWRPTNKAHEEQLSHPLPNELLIPAWCRLPGM